MSDPVSYSDVKMLAGQAAEAETEAGPTPKLVASVEAVDPYESLRVALSREWDAQMDRLTGMVAIICVSCILLSITVALVVVRIAL